MVKIAVSRSTITATVDAVATPAIVPLLRTAAVTGSGSRKNANANSDALCSTAEMFPLKKSSALTIAAA